MHIWIDAGHGGKDPGAISHDRQFLEKDQTLGVATRLQRILIEKKFTAYMTRSGNDYVTLQKRVSHTKEDDIFISIHFNASQSHRGEGFESFSKTKADYKTTMLHFMVHESLRNLNSKYDLKDRGKKTADFYVLENSKCPAVLIELLFIDNKTDMQKILNTDYYNQVATTIADAVVQYKKALTYL